MFRDQRDFRALALCSPKLNGLDNVAAIFPFGSLDESGAFSEFRDAEFQVRHYYYLSKKRFTESLELEHTKGKNDHFRYDMYICGMPIKKSRFLTIIAAPFRTMMVELFDVIKNKTSGLGMRYQKVNQESLIAKILGGDNLKGAISLTRMESFVLTDPAASVMSLRGQNVLQSRSYKVLAKTHGSGLQPAKCRIKYDDGSFLSTKLETDQFGNFAFRVRKDAVNFPSIGTIFQYLYSQNLVEDTVVLPLSKEEDTSNA